MAPKKFQATACAYLGSALNWEKRIADVLGVSKRAVRRWMDGAEIPEGIVERLGDLIQLRELTPWPRDEWLIGDTPDGYEMIAHLQPPRFVARVVALDDPNERAFDDTTGVVYRVDPKTIICEIAWIDEPHENEITQLMEAAANAIEAMN